jgi:hypothetical protein
VRRYLVVANQTLAGEHLTEAVRTRHQQGSARFHVVVPATHPQDQATWTEGEARANAERQLATALARFREMGADVDGEVGDDSPLQAIGDAVAAETYDEIILSTLPAGASRWLKQDLPHRVERSFGLPVTHVTAEAEPTDS